MDQYLLSTAVNEIYAWRLLKLKRELLLALENKDDFARYHVQRGGVDLYEKYAAFVVPHEQADWTGLTMRVSKGGVLSQCLLKGHGNEADFLGILHKSIPMSPLHYHSSRSDFCFEFAEIFVIEKRLPDSASRGVDKIF